MRSNRVIWALTAAIVGGGAAWSPIAAQPGRATSAPGAAAGSVPADSAGTAIPLRSTAAGILAATNEYRATQNLGPLRAQPALTAAAQKFAEFMARTGEFDHRAGGTTPMQRAKAEGYQAMYLAENIAWNSYPPDTPSLAQDFVTGWINSPGHQANMRSETASEIGIGVARGPDGRNYAVQVFGLPVGGRDPVARRPGPASPARSAPMPATEGATPAPPMSRPLPSGLVQPPAQPPELVKVIDLIVVGTNKLRAQEKRPPVTAQAQLNAAAQKFAEYLAATDQFDHQAGGTSPGERASQAGYQSCLILENLGLMWGTVEYTPAELARDFVDGWWNSEGHRANLLHERVSEIGVGVTRAANGKYYGVQLFGAPGAAQFNYRIVNNTRQPLPIVADGFEFTVKPNVTFILTGCSSAVLKAGDQSFAVVPGDRFEVILDGAGKPSLRQHSQR